MINQIQTIRGYFGRVFTDIPFKLEVDRDMAGNELANGDRASAVLTVNGGRYRVSCTSAYIEPPLGRIKCVDLSDDSIIEGDKKDDTWAEVAQYIRGQRPNVVTLSQPPVGPVIPAPTPIVPFDGHLPHVGLSVVFYTERGEYIAGMGELAAIITRVISPTLVNLTVFPDCGDSFWRTNVVRKGVQEYYCWDFVDDPPTVHGSKQVIAHDSQPSLKIKWKEDSAAVLNETAIKRGPGRPRKSEIS